MLFDTVVVLVAYVFIYVCAVGFST